MNIHDRIQEHLRDGTIVTSVALGRVGTVMCVRPDGVEICRFRNTKDKRHRHIHGFTTFLRGDEVHLKKLNGRVYIANVGLEPPYKRFFIRLQGIAYRLLP